MIYSKLKHVTIQDPTGTSITPRLIQLQSVDFKKDPLFKGDSYEIGLVFQKGDLLDAQSIVGLTNVPLRGVGELFVAFDELRRGIGDSFTELDKKIDEKLNDQKEEILDQVQKMLDDLVISQSAYGIQFDTTISTPECVRVGNMSLHKTLPIQSRMKGCILNDDGKVVEYLDPTDWTGAVRDGSRGQVMVEIPQHYRKFETDGTKRTVWLSETQLPGYHEVPKCYISAYEASLDRTNNKLASVVNTTAQYRGGDNTAEWDDAYRSLLGKPVSRVSRTNFRKYARARKANSLEWNMLTYDTYKTLYWLFVVEYATLNNQSPYNAQPTSDGFKQGGLGLGVTNMPKWKDYNGYNPLVPCGITDSIGNKTGVVEYTINNNASESPITYTAPVPRYRGVENPFGHIWKIVDGINIQINPSVENGGNGLSQVFVCSDPELFVDNRYDDYSYIGNEARVEGIVQQIIFGEFGDIIPTMCGGSTSTYFCDYHYTTITTSVSDKIALFGGDAYSSQNAGMTYLFSSYNSDSADRSFGSRLCFIPKTDNA